MYSNNNWFHTMCKMRKEDGVIESRAMQARQPISLIVGIAIGRERFNECVVE